MISLLAGIPGISYIGSLPIEVEGGDLLTFQFRPKENEETTGIIICDLANDKPLSIVEGSFAEDNTSCIRPISKLIVMDLIGVHYPVKDGQEPSTSVTRLVQGMCRGDESILSSPLYNITCKSMKSILGCWFKIGHGRPGILKAEFGLGYLCTVLICCCFWIARGATF